ncbi:MAG: polysaccharide biosynthesis tyrosine autokinase [Anaerolineae bacterium]|nr:polysaccharide biosynthesis tyrosine autokinase [Anaerolineae bacterium]
MNTSSSASSILETIKRYGLALWRRAGLILLLALLGAGVGYAYSKTQTPMYSSSIRVMVMRPLQEQSSDLTRFMTNQQIVNTYAQLGQTAGFNQKVIQRAGAIGFVSAFAMQDSQFIILSAQTPNPQAAAPLLNAAVEVLAEEIRAVQASRYTQVEDGLTLQIDGLVVEIERTQQAVNERYKLLVAAEKEKLEADIYILEGQLAAATPDSPQASQLQTRLLASRQAYAGLLQTNRVAASRDSEVTRLERTLALYQNLYGTLSTNRENVRLSKLQGTPTLIKVEEPFEPLAPFTPRTRRNSLLAGLAGLGLGLALVIVFEFLSDTLKPGEAVRQRLRIPVLGQLPLGRPEDGLPVENDPRSLEGEAYRILRTNLAFSAIDRPLQIILLTSPGPGEGKSTLAANLAAVLSQSGRKVLLVDANLRRPRLHKLLDLQNRLGLSDAIRSAETDLAELIQPYHGQNQVKFDVLTSGALPPNPLELLVSEQMGRVLGQAAVIFDVVLLDAPGLMIPDAQVLSARADGVLLVGWAGRTRVGAIHNALEILARSRARVLGLAINAIPGQLGGDRGR